MRIRALFAITLLAVAGVACDDADPPKRDGGMDARKDSGTDARDGATADRTPDSLATDGGPDAIQPDGATSDGSVDTTPSPDTQLPDRTPDTAPPMVDAPPDMPPDTAPDLAPDTTPMMPDTAPLIPDAMPDTALVSQPFMPMNGCTMEEQFDDVTTDEIYPFDWIIENDDPVCIKVKFGNLVRWVVNPMDIPGQTFATHPVQQFPADPLSKITGKNTPDEEDYDVIFDRTVGTFGFRCSIHPNIMRGAIWVVP